MIAHYGTGYDFQFSLLVALLTTLRWLVIGFIGTIIEHVAHSSDLRDIPSINISIKGRSSKKHVLHINDIRDILSTKISIEGMRRKSQIRWLAYIHRENYSEVEVFICTSLFFYTTIHRFLNGLNICIMIF